MHTPETLFSPAQRDRLEKAIHRRASCHAFAGAPSPGDWAALSYAAARFELPGARLLLMNCREELFTGTLLNMGRVSGCTAIAAVTASSDMAGSRMMAGFSGEALVLEAVSMGLSTCWIGSTYRRRLLQPELRQGEAILAIIALGQAEKPLQLPLQRKRKPLEKLCHSDLSLWPEELLRVARSVQEAPSAMGMQPWEMSFGSDRFILDCSDRAALDLGIAMCHAELTLQTPHSWHFAQTRHDPAAWAESTK